MGSPLVEMSQEAFSLPIVNAMRTQFLMGTAAVRHMEQSKDCFVNWLVRPARKVFESFV
ncbi:hypothetical protein [Cohnella herbarum]|uniref:Uncharacterized protein n=1 Tax=Cohnella herbarum TaxID=2728023 RepID=A0A7Z2VEM8_9BACL|nr:hypothetical protein [Cohnella herbarum]QJD81722.1 hypothetical protein HH215_24440 [Cohnella herbarum]